MMKADVFLDVVFVCRLVQIFHDRRTIGDGLLLFPWLESVAQRIHVAVRPNAWIFEEIPGPANGIAPLKDGKGSVRALRLQMICCANAGNAGADNQNVKVFFCHYYHSSFPA